MVEYVHSCQGSSGLCIRVSSVASERFQSCDVRPEVEKGLIWGVLRDRFLPLFLFCFFFFSLGSLCQSGRDLIEKFCHL